MYTPIGIFEPGIITKAKVDEIFEEASAALASGQTIDEWTSESTTVRKSYPLPPDQLIVECNLFYKKLARGNVKRTQANFHTF
jgi:hypothetical protein